ncbi:unnamed protein product [Linum tenue]|uniref:Uncharacterized protein n=1 Tax=Linum tenue TaxID=586396 RepID=A0AAV0JJV2_9ROSI|nr:unnamed protein product [Linum tenue]
MTTTNPDSSVPPNNSSLPAAATTAGQVQLRMSDYLALPQDDEPDEKSLETHTKHRDLRSLLMGEEGFFQEDRRRVSYCSSPPCRLVARWMSWIRRVNFKGISRKCCRRETVGNRVEAGVQPRCLTNGLNDVGCRKETCFNAGIGAYLLYLVAATRNELDRFNAARVEMEAILQNTKQLQRRRSVEVDGGDDDVLFEVSIRKSVVVEEDDGDDDDECEAEFPTNLYALPAAAASSASSSNVVSGSETPKREDFAEDMEQLEAELEAELELLQLQLDGDTSMEQSQFLRVTNRDETGSSKSYSTTSTEEEEEEEVIDPEYGEEDAECPNAIHPYELASKLHEVLEARQQEEIRELEAALELVKRKLVEKELQVAWWKAVARGRRLSIGSSQEVQS